jgi:hypothetical protein
MATKSWRAVLRVALRVVSGLGLMLVGLHCIVMATSPGIITSQTSVAMGDGSLVFIGIPIFFLGTMLALSVFVVSERGN